VLLQPFMNYEYIILSKHTTTAFLVQDTVCTKCNNKRMVDKQYVCLKFTFLSMSLRMSIISYSSAGYSLLLSM
jgi:hypothetical protein